MLRPLRLTLAALLATTALAACSSAPDERVGGQSDGLSRCKINHDCPDPGDGPPPRDPPPHHDPPPSCQTAHPSCSLEVHTQWEIPDLQAAGCTWEATYHPNDPALFDWIFVAYCAYGPAWDNFKWKGPVDSLHKPDPTHYIGSNVCDHCLPPAAPGHFYFFFNDRLGPLCQGGCPGQQPPFI